MRLPSFHLLALVFCWTVLPTQHAVVLVHIGHTIPPYLATCVQQIRLFNTGDVYLVANKNALEKCKPVLEQYHVVGVPIEQLKRSAAHNIFAKNTGLSQGFWQYATERFFYLDAMIEQFDLKNVFHLENDNMLYVDLESLVPLFEKHYRGIAATFDNERRCIPGFIFIKNTLASNNLVRFIAQISGQGKNDMESIGLYRALYGWWIDCLPIIMPEYSKNHRLQSLHGHTAKNSAEFSKNISTFDSIFDAAALGQYLGGIDSRGGVSKPGFINESCIFNPSLLRYSWEKDEQGRLVPYASYLDKSYRINNLHIHSKRLELFLS